MAMATRDDRRNEQRNAGCYEAFLSELRRSLDLLRGTRVRASLHCVEVGGLPSHLHRAILVEALEDLGTLGIGPDGRYAFLYLGPHTAQELEERVAERVARVAGAYGDAPRCLAVRLRGRAWWTDQVSDPHAELDALLGEPTVH